MIAERFKVGDLVTWNSEAGRVSGTFIKVHTIDVDYKGHTRYASEDDPQYEIKSTKTDHIAMHKGQSFIFASRDGPASQSGAEFRCAISWTS
jgi:hypothetical protein